MRGGSRKGAARAALKGGIMKKVLIISLIVALALCASLTACTDLISGVTVDELPEHVERLVLRVNGETPTYYAGPK